MVNLPLTPQHFWQSLLKTFIQSLMGKEKLKFYEKVDWETESDRFRKPNLDYPQYYSAQNFHGIQGGYLNAIAAITYDVITPFASPPNEMWIRQQLIHKIKGHPKRILDLGCGTGSTTLMLKQAFPEAIVIGLDLSPYMLVVADYKTKPANLEIQWQQGLAENTGFEADTFDLVTAAFLFHETPPSIAQLILQEAFRLLQPQGQLIILDGNQKKLRHADWLISLFKEPYSKAYAAGSVNDWMIAADFEAVETSYLGWIQQITSGRKPMNLSSSK